MQICDGCGATADDAHIRQRIERLELATRFRPIHIQLLLLGAAPPMRTEDYFYHTATSRDERSEASRGYFDQIVECGGVAPGSGITEESALAEFQHRGFYLAYALECPIEPNSELTAALQRVASTVIKRVERSYKPKHVALLSASLAQLISHFGASGMSDRLLLNNGEPFSLPLDLPATSSAARTVSLKEQLDAVLPHLG